MAKSLIGRPKEFLEERTKTTARIPKALQKVMQKRCIDLGLDQTDAINKGLEFWMAYQDGDGHLRKLLDLAVSNWKRSQPEAHDKSNEKTTTEGKSGVPEGRVSLSGNHAKKSA